MRSDQRLMYDVKGVWPTEWTPALQSVADALRAFGRYRDGCQCEVWPGDAHNPPEIERVCDSCFRKNNRSRAMKDAYMFRYRYLPMASMFRLARDIKLYTCPFDDGPDDVLLSQVRAWLMERRAQTKGSKRYPELVRILNDAGDYEVVG